MWKLYREFCNNVYAVVVYQRYFLWYLSLVFMKRHFIDYQLGLACPSVYLYVLVNSTCVRSTFMLRLSLFPKWHQYSDVLICWNVLKMLTSRVIEKVWYSKFLIIWIMITIINNMLVLYHQYPNVLKLVIYEWALYTSCYLNYSACVFNEELDNLLGNISALLSIYSFRFSGFIEHQRNIINTLLPTSTQLTHI